MLDVHLLSYAMIAMAQMPAVQLSYATMLASLAPMLALNVGLNTRHNL